MAVNVHGGAEVGKILAYLIGFTAFVVVALTWVPHWISPDSANIAGNTGGTARMIQ
jgi:heme/copper-type cytochrome/quinol oxidase subunit 4